MSKFFTEAGVPKFLPADFDGNDIEDAWFVDHVSWDNSRWSEIIIEWPNGSEVCKDFKHNEYPAAIDVWRWLKERILHDTSPTKISA